MGGLRGGSFPALYYFFRGLSRKRWNKICGGNRDGFGDFAEALAK
jgi:hypothetical protein